MYSSSFIRTETMIRPRRFQHSGKISLFLQAGFPRKVTDYVVELQFIPFVPVYLLQDVPKLIRPITAKDKTLIVPA